MAAGEVRQVHGTTHPPAFDSDARLAILSWYDANGRDLPFRRTTDPYAILVSEAMAQQTQAARAGEAWLRFLEIYPSVGALAAATPADVLRAWRGLGYNRRALNLWRAARTIVERHAGVVPADVGELEALPGVGPYTARALAAIAFGIPVGAVDTNVRRVLGRAVFGGAATSSRELQAIADVAVPAERPAAWTHAVMDVGATFCRPVAPACDGCPVRAWCRFASGDVSVRRPSRRMAPRKAPPFTSTSRWLRGRIVDRLRAAPDGGWTRVQAPIGEHDATAVAGALTALAREGMVEVQPSAAGDGAWLARLPSD